MYKEHWTFEIKDSHNNAIWRYMDFWKFLNLMETECLYFSNAENLGDQSEGRYPKEVLELMLEQDKVNSNKCNENLNTFLEKNLRSETLISSWTYNEKESFAMWKMYAKDKMGIAIKTDLESLKKAFNKTDRDVYIGEVNYFNKNKFDYPIYSMYYPFLVKLDYYEFEKEIRCITSCTNDEVKESKLVAVDLNELLKTILISPNSKPEFIKLLEIVRKEYNLNFKVELSEVNDYWL